MALNCVVTVRLSMVHECVVAALGLPKSTGSEVVASEKTSCSTDGAAKMAGGEIQKFSIGVTLPTVPIRLIKRILSGEYMDMGVIPGSSSAVNCRPLFSSWR